MRTFHLKRGTLWLLELQPYKNHSKTHYYPKYKGHVSRWPDWALKVRGWVWKLAGI